MNLFERVREIALVNSVSQILSWDQETYLPEASSSYRSEQLAYLAAHGHRLATSDDFLKALGAAEEKNEPTDSSNVAQIRRETNRAIRLSTEFVTRESTVQSSAHHAWIAARKASDFSLFSSHLEKLVSIASEKAELWGYESEPYDALLEPYERGSSTQVISELFDHLLKELTPLAVQAVENSKRFSPSLPKGEYPIEAQKKFNARVATEMGFDMKKGRIDTTAHPFCTTLGPDDVRLTTRYMETDFTSSLFGVMHEAGHGMYEQGLPSSEYGLPSGTAVSLGIHESQSRLWENQIGRSPSFWKKYYPIAQEYFPTLKDFSLENFIHYIHRADFSPIRVEADEATYDLHIILRFRIERMLLNREIKVGELPSVWSDLFHESFGFSPANDAQGCLQDIHWSMGGIGYFPTYTLGNINAAQLFATAKKNPEIAKSLDAANYEELLKWLRGNIHQHGSSMDSRSLIKHATGREPEIHDYIQHLQARYL